MFLFHNYISSLSHIRNLIFAFFFFASTLVAYSNSKDNTSLLSSNNNIFNWVKKDNGVHNQPEKESFPKHRVTKNKNNKATLFETLFEIEEEDISSCPLKAFKLSFYYTLYTSTAIKDKHTNAKCICCDTNLFPYKKSKLFIQHRAYLI